MDSTLYQPLVSEQRQQQLPWWQKAWSYVKSFLSVPEPTKTLQEMTATASKQPDITETQYQAYEEP